MSRSLRLRLTIAVVAVTAPLMACFAFMLYRAVSSAVWDSFDRQLADDARVMADLIELEQEGYELDIEAMVARFAADPGAATRFQLWQADGAALIPSTTGDGLRQAQAPADAPDVWEGSFDDGTAARYVGFRFVPRVDEEDFVPTGPVDPLFVSLGRDTQRTDLLLAGLASWFWMLGTGMVLVSSGVAGWAVSRGLRPMTRVTHDIAAIDEEHLDRGLVADEVPIELRPLVDRLNELLARLDTAFARERQFSADVAHELRTPLAVLRASTELALDEPGEAGRGRLRGMLETIDQTAALVEDLLTLARAEAAQGEVLCEPVDIRDLVEREWEHHRPAAEARDLEFRNEIASASYTDSDPTMLRHIVSNLLSNAAAYTERGGWIEVLSRPEEGLVIEVRDSGPPIPVDQLERVFDRFWRADQARSAVGEHAGIGLALVKSLADRLGLAITAQNDGEHVSFCLRAPTSGP